MGINRTQGSSAGAKYLLRSQGRSLLAGYSPPHRTDLVSYLDRINTYDIFLAQLAFFMDYVA